MKLQDFDFRIWNNSTDKFIELNISDNIRAIPRKNDDLVLELWSGIYDKKGKRIYEGDIVKNRDLDTLLCLYDSHNLRFVFKYINRKEYDICYTPMDTLEVLGNTHENADLLKERE